MSAQQRTDLTLCALAETASAASLPTATGAPSAPASTRPHAAIAPSTVPTDAEPSRSAGAPLSFAADASGARQSLCDAWLAFRGRSLDDERGDGWLLGVHPDDRSRVNAAWLDAVRARRAYVCEFRLRRADGVYRTVLESAAPCPLVGRAAHENTEAVAFVGTCLDVSDRRRREASSRFLADASALLTGNADCHATLNAIARLAVPALADACAIDLTDADGHLRPVAFAHTDPNRARGATELLLRVRASVAHARGADGVAATEAPVLLPRVAEHTTHDAGLSRDAHEALDPAVLLALGVHSYVAAPITVQARVVGTLALASLSPSLVFDIDDLHTVEAASARIGRAIELAQRLRDVRAEGRARDELLATVSHELRTPLSAIVGWAGLLRRNTLDDEGRRRAVDAIERSARDQARVVEDLLDASRMASGTLRLALRRFDLVSAVRAAVEGARDQAAARSVTLEVRLPKHAISLAGDPVRMRQIAAHLLANAVKFTPPNGTVRVELERVEPASRDDERDGDRAPRGLSSSTAHAQARLRVSDDGRGIRPELLPFIFERFRQGDASATRTHGGLGLGLALVQHLVALHGGSVHAESAGEGRGASFLVTVPLAQGAQVGPIASPAARGGALTDVSVLVVEGPGDARDLLCAGLSEAGALVRTAMNSDEALSTFHAQPPDILVAATPTPWPQGLSLLRAVRALEAAQGSLVPSIALTDAATPDEVRALLAAGFQIALPRPVDPRRLVTSVVDLAGRATRAQSDSAEHE